MVDSETYYTIDQPDSRPALGKAPDGMPNGVSQCLCPVYLKYNIGASKRKNTKFNEYDNIYPEKTNKLTEHQYLICSGAVMAFVMDAREWGTYI